MAASVNSSDAFLRDLIGGRYRRVRLIGQGSHGTVWECEDIRTSQLVACKSIPHVRLPLSHARDSAHVRAPMRVGDICTEVRALKTVGGHPNIIGLIEVIVDSTEAHVFMELAPGGDLLTELMRRGPLSEPLAATVVRQLASAVAFCHACGVMHRDVKPDNVLLVRPPPPSAPTPLAAQAAVALAAAAAEAERFRGAADGESSAGSSARSSAGSGQLIENVRDHSSNSSSGSAHHQQTNHQPRHHHHLPGHAVRVLGNRTNLFGLVNCQSTSGISPRGNAPPPAGTGATSLPNSPTKSKPCCAGSSADSPTAPASPGSASATASASSSPFSSPARNKSPRPCNSAPSLSANSSTATSSYSARGAKLRVSPLGEDYVGAERQILGIKLADFGVSAILKGGMRDTRRSRGAGTPAYMAPEMGWRKGAVRQGEAAGGKGNGVGGQSGGNNPGLSDLPEYGVKADVWSLGVTLCTILTARIPSHPVDFSKNEWQGVSEDAKDLIRRMLVVDPDQRLSSFQVLEHPWLNQTAVRSLDPAVRCPHLLSSSLPGEASGNQVMRVVCA